MVPATERRHAAFWVVAASFAAFLLVACGSGPPRDGNADEASTPGSTATPPNAEVFFPTIPEQDAVPTARTGGELALDGKGCLRITRDGEPGPQDLVPIWPSTLELDTEGGQVRILDGKWVVAQVGEAVVMSGGETNAEVLKGNDLMDEQELRELSERCPDYYWFVGGGTRIPSNASGSASPTAAPVPDVVDMKVEEACKTLRRAGGNAYVFGKREVGDGSVKPGHVVEQRPATPGPEDPRNTFLFVAKPFPDILPDDTSCTRREVGPPG